MFGCVCYARTKAAERKKLEDRSRVLIHLGIEPGTKAYRLLDPDSNKIVVSRDVHFDEEKQWNWSTTETKGSEESGSFEVELIPLQEHNVAPSINEIEDSDEETRDEDMKTQKNRLCRM